MSLLRRREEAQARGLSVGSALAWIAAYFCVMLLYTTIDLLVWRRLDSPCSHWLNLGTMAVLSAGFLYASAQKAPFRVRIFQNVTGKGVLMALLCVLLLYGLLDLWVDPLMERCFPMSEEAYQQTLLSLSESPLTAFLHVCLLAPLVEEFLMRGLVLGGLLASRGAAVALCVSTLLFALLHFNMVQTLSALLSGLVLGALYLRTGSLLCCMLAHGGYNAVTCLMAVAPWG